MSQEIRKLIQEALGSDDNYRTDVEDTYYYNKAITSGDDYISESKAIVVWAIDQEHRSWGIKTFEPRIVSLSAHIEVWKENKQDYIPTSKDFNLDEYEVTITKSHEKGAIMPIEVDIDEDRKTIEIEFAFI